MPGSGEEVEVGEAEVSLSVLPPTSLLLFTLHWRMQVSFPPIDRRCESLCVKHTLVTWLPWPSYLWLGAWRINTVSVTSECHKVGVQPGGTVAEAKQSREATHLIFS